MSYQKTFIECHTKRIPLHVIPKGLCWISGNKALLNSQKGFCLFNRQNWHYANYPIKNNKETLFSYINSFYLKMSDMKTVCLFITEQSYESFDGTQMHKAATPIKDFMPDDGTGKLQVCLQILPSRFFNFSKLYIHFTNYYFLWCCCS